MNIESATMQVDRWSARTKYLEYREAVKRRYATDPVGASKSEEQQLTKAYAAIARGECVIDARKAIEDAGVDERGMPRLAIARADWKFVHCYRYDGGMVVFDHQGRSYSRKEETRVARLVHVRLPAVQGRDTSGRAQVPLVPPAHKPAGHLKVYRILFEAVWERQPPEPDPLLLRPLGGPFYVVCAQWDLSPLEQAVLRARL